MSDDLLSPAFKLTWFSYGLDFVLVPIAVVALMLTSAITWPLIALGVLAWTLAEYWIHRSVFHGHTRYEPMHQAHHAAPKAFIGVASWGTFAGFALVWLLCGSAFVIGVMLGYLAYCGIHVYMHHGNRARFGRYVEFMFKHHAGHHRGGRGNFGVTSPVWDYVFGSYQRSR